MTGNDISTVQVGEAGGLVLKNLEDYTQAVERLGNAFGAVAKAARQFLASGEGVVTVGADLASNPDSLVYHRWAGRSGKPVLQAAVNSRSLGRYWQALSIEQAEWLAKAGHNLRRSRRLHLHKLLRYECRAVFGRG